MHDTSTFSFTTRSLHVHLQHTHTSEAFVSPVIRRVAVGDLGVEVSWFCTEEINDDLEGMLPLVTSRLIVKSHALHQQHPSRVHNVQSGSHHHAVSCVTTILLPYALCMHICDVERMKRFLRQHLPFMELPSMLVRIAVCMNSVTRHHMQGLPVMPSLVMTHM